VYIYNNVLWGNKYAGISVGAEKNMNVRIYNNTIYDNVDTGLRFYARGPTVDIKNNIVFQNGSSAERNWTTNAGYGPGSPHESHNLTADPSLISTDPGDPNFLKLASNSPAIDAGTFIDLADLSEDVLGRPRPQGAVDIGAHEHGGGSSEPRPVKPRRLRIAP
jgi:hypothetical protein